MKRRLLFASFIVVLFAGHSADAQMCEYPIDTKTPCPDAELKQHSPPTSNGCGPEGKWLNAAIRGLTPNGFIPAPWNEQFIDTFLYYNAFGKADFTSACNTHDECYGTCGSKKMNCDDAFLTNLIEACKKYPSSMKDAVLDQLHENCLARARAYWDAVSLADVVSTDSSAIPDITPFQDAQETVCECCRSEEPGMGGAGGMSGGGAGGAGGSGGVNDVGSAGSYSNAGSSGTGDGAGGSGGAGSSTKTTCGPQGDADRYEFTGDGSWDDLVYDTVTGLTWHRGTEIGDERFPTCVSDFREIPREEAYCCNWQTPAATPGCNWSGFQALCNQRGMRLATGDELYEFAKNAGLCFDNWDSWGQQTGDWIAARVTRTGALVSFMKDVAIPETSAIWYGKDRLRCVR